MTPNMAIVLWRRWMWLELSTCVYSLFQTYLLASHCCSTTAINQLIIRTWLYKGPLISLALAKWSQTPNMAIVPWRRWTWIELSTQTTFICESPRLRWHTDAIHLLGHPMAPLAQPPRQPLGGPLVLTSWHNAHTSEISFISPRPTTLSLTHSEEVCLRRNVSVIRVNICDIVAITVRKSSVNVGVNSWSQVSALWLSSAVYRQHAVPERYNISTVCLGQR